MRPSPFLRSDVLDLADDRLVAGRRAHLRDPGAHQAATEHADRLDRHSCHSQSADSLYSLESARSSSNSPDRRSD